MPQREDLSHERRVVPLARVRPLVGGPGYPGLVEFLSQRLVVAVREHRLVIGRVERQEPARQTCCLRRRAGALDDHRRQARELHLVAHHPRPRIRRIEHVLVELRLHAREPLHHLPESLLAIRGQRHPGEPEVAQRIFQELALLGCEARTLLVEDALIGRAERFVLRKLGVIAGEKRQAGVVRRAQLLAVQHVVQVTDRRPRAREHVMHPFDRRDETVPAVGPRVEQGGELASVSIDQRAHRRFGMLGPYPGEGWQLVVRQQRVQHRFCVRSIDPVYFRRSAAGPASASQARTRPQRIRRKRDTRGAGTGGRGVPP